MNVLGYSRAVDVVAMARCDAEHTYGALIRPFEAFGGVPVSVLVDDQNAAVLDWSDGRPRFYPRFTTLARQRGSRRRRARRGGPGSRALPRIQWWLDRPCFSSPASRFSLSR